MIYINDKVRIKRIDEKNLQIEVYKESISKKTKEKTMEWKWVGYYSNLKQAFQGALRNMLLYVADEELQLKDIVEHIERAESDIQKAMSNHSEEDDLLQDIKARKNDIKNKGC